jgi:hypothetical protein
MDPDGVEWEVYHVNYDPAEKHGGSIEAPKPGIGNKAVNKMSRTTLVPGKVGEGQLLECLQAKRDSANRD